MSAIPHPILLIHGFRGQPDDWTLDSGFRDYLINQGGFDPDLVRLFHYGYRMEQDQRLYDYQKDIRASAHRLVSDSPLADALDIQLATLSRESQARGGPARVDIIAHSMGGMVARYYLSCQEPDEWGTHNEGLVGKLITIATPHQGAEILSAFRSIPRNSLLWHLLRLIDYLPIFQDKPIKDVERFESGLGEATVHHHEGTLDPSCRAVLTCQAVQQLVPGNEFLVSVNSAGKTPQDVAYFCLAGNIIYDITISFFGLTLHHREISLGDLLVNLNSAIRLPDVRPIVYAFTQRVPFVLSLGHIPFLRPLKGTPAHRKRQDTVENIAHARFPVSHGALLENRQVQETVLAILSHNMT